MKTAEKLASGWLLLLGFVFLMLPGTALHDKNSTQKQTMPLCSTPNVDAARDSAMGGLILGVPSVLLGGCWLALGVYRQQQQEKALKQAGDRFHSTFFRLIQAGNGSITVFNFAMAAQLTATAAKQYLDEKAKEFDATFVVSNEGVISYYFPSVNTSYIADSSSTAVDTNQFDIILEDSGKNKITVIKVIRELTSLDLKEAKDLVEATPTVIKRELHRLIAEEIKKQLEEVGAKVTIL